MNAMNGLKCHLRTIGAVLLLGLPWLPAHGTVSVDQIPLTAQQSLPPDITLMFDDSGSMAWSIMPDYSYLVPGKTPSPTTDMRNSSINGVYYNPTITYTPPTTVSGGLYPSNTLANFPQVLSDPVSGDTSLTDITQAYGSYGDSVGSNNGSFRFFDAYNCSNGYGYGCAAYAFAYVGSDGAVHHISTDCSPFSSCVAPGDTSGAAAPAGIPAGVNVANWYSYYSSRIKLAKSGLLTAFGSLDPTVRVGFGSINGSQVPFINDTYSGPLKYSFSTDTTSNNLLAAVQAFGDGSSGTQRANFWNWVSGLNANNGTPLRQALNAVGQYYTTDQPWENSPSDSTKLACRQAYTILTTDGFWNDNSVNLPTNAYNDNIDGAPGTNTTNTTTTNYTYPYYVTHQQCTDAYNAAQPGASHEHWTKTGPYSFLGYGVCTWTQTTTTASGGPAVTITGPNNQSYTYSAHEPYSDSYQDTLADVAMDYWLTDLQPNLSNEVPTNTEDPAFWQHMTTFTLGLGFSPLYADQTTQIPIPQVFSWANGGAAVSGFDSNGGWPQPSANSLNNIADLAHAAVDGHGGFYSATTPQAFSSGLLDALKRVQERVGTGASLAANSTKLDTGTTTYQAVYYTGVWKGDLKAYSVDPNSGAIAATPTWTAAAVLPAAASRNIYTYNPAGGSKSFVTFNAANLSAGELAKLGSTSTDQTNIINYLRGDPSLEQKNTGGIYRNRDTALGDIVDSQPVYVGAPSPDTFANRTFTGSSTYSTFATNNVSRTPLIWIAANDGMLHAFDAASGVETFAYLPAAVINAGIADLADPGYGSGSTPHQLYNDGELTVGDVYMNSAWHTVLVGTTGRGPAKAVYALDVTTPSSPTLLWERSAGDGLSNSDYIGEMVGKPVIAQTANGTWSVLIGNGYNSAQNKAALLQFDMASGSLTVHATDGSTNNGLAAPAVWIGDVSNGLSTIAYAGDLNGRVWSFDLSSASSTGTLLFTAVDSAGTAQPITGGMLAGQDPATGNVWLFFGTGLYLAQSDLSNLNVQSWYGIIVQSNTASLVGNLSGGRAALAQRSITAETEPNAASNPPTLGARTVTVPTQGDMSGKSGWYIDLVSPVNGAEGERMVTPNQFQGTLLIGTTRIPQSSDPCNPSGRGWIMAIDPFTGGNPSAAFFDLNNDGLFNSSDELNGVPAAGIGFNSIPNNPIFVGNTMLTSFDNATTSSISTAGTVGALSRVSWRELVTQ